jgi:hypothetical protein
MKKKKQGKKDLQNIVLKMKLRLESSDGGSLTSKD